MKTYIKSSNDGIDIITDLAKRIAEAFNDDIEDGGFDGWEDYVIRTNLSSSDIKEEIISFAQYLWGEDHKQHKANYYVEDNGTVSAGLDTEYSYRKFKSLIMKYVIHDDTDDDLEDD